jgi:hypothetical protein
MELTINILLVIIGFALLVFLAKIVDRRDEDE